jgi:acyl-CoA thioester hydrolase
LDILQHVNNASYVVWAETAHCIYLHDVLGISFAEANGIVLARVSFDYEHPLGYREEVAVGCRIVRIGRKSFDFAYEIWSETHQKLAARGLSTMVAFDHHKKASIPIPDRWREIIPTHEIIAPAME